MKSKNKALKPGSEGTRAEQCNQVDHLDGRSLDTTHAELGADEPSDLDELDQLDADDGRWDVFLFDDECDPIPEHGDFWMPDE